MKKLGIKLGIFDFLEVVRRVTTTDNKWRFGGIDSIVVSPDCYRCRLDSDYGWAWLLFKRTDYKYSRIRMEDESFWLDGEQAGFWIMVNSTVSGKDGGKLNWYRSNYNKRY